MTKPNLVADKFFVELVQTGKLYVSNDGMVRNLVTHRWVGYDNGRGYKAVTVMDGRKKRVIRIHRLVFLLYGDGFTEDKIYVNHKNGLKSDNLIANLEATTHEENMHHAWVTGLSTSFPPINTTRHGELGTKAKLTNAQASEIRSLYLTGIYSHRELGVMYGISPMAAGQIIRGKSYKQALDYDLTLG